MNYTISDLLQLLGSKDIELFLLRRRIEECEAMLKACQPSLPTPEVH